MPSGIVIGAGIAGLAAAIALQQAGYTVTILEAAATLRTGGGALSIWANGNAALDHLGISLQKRTMPIDRLFVGSRDGAALLGPLDVLAPACMVTRADLHSALIESIRNASIRYSSAVRAVADDGPGVRVTLADATTQTADMVIDAGGIWSPIAESVIGTLPVYRGYGGVLGISEAIAGVVSDGTAAEYWHGKERFGVFDVVGGRRYWFYVCSQPADTPSLSHEALARRAAKWPAAVRRAIDATADGLAPFAIHARSAPSRLGRGRILCIGDAAHAMEPNLGQGACQALEDAVALSIVARRAAPERIVAEFEALRLKRLGKIVRRASEGGFAAHGPAPVRAIMQGAMRLLPTMIAARSAQSIHTMPRYA